MQILIRKYQEVSGTIYQEGNGYTGAIDIGYDGKGGRQRKQPPDCVARTGRSGRLAAAPIRRGGSCQRGIDGGGGSWAAAGSRAR